MKKFVLGGGCFWCLDAVYRKTKGVVGVVSGYTGGHTPAPDYYSVCSGRTGHAEVVAVTFEEAIVPEDVILGIFFTMHNPTTLNRQGYDVGTQYRSSMFYGNEEQRRVFEEAIARHQSQWDHPIVTTLEPAATFHRAEELHQDYYEKNPDAGYCSVIIDPKLTKARKYYSAWLGS